MIINQILKESPKVGRTFQHLEDLVFVDGTTGANNALARIMDIVRNPQIVRYKWDGKPTVYWGREPDGKFVMTGSGGWRKRDGTGRVDNAGELAKYLMNTGNDDNQNRQKFATEFASLWPLFESATPADFRGYVYGDLLYFHRPPLVNGVFSMQPSKVTYSVQANSPLGKRIALSTAAVIGHAYYPQFGMNDGLQQPMENFSIFNQTQGLIVIGPKHVNIRPQIDLVNIKGLQQYIATNAKFIDAFLNDDYLNTQKMGSFKNILYSFSNSMNKEGNMTGLSNLFIDWLSQSKQSAAMQSKIKNWIAQNHRGFIAVFYILEHLRDIKNQLIDQFDKETGEITQSMIGYDGKFTNSGEGYVVYSPQGNVKLVRRERWKPIFN